MKYNYIREQDLNLGENFYGVFSNKTDSLGENWNVNVEYVMVNNPKKTSLKFFSVDVYREMFSRFRRSHLSDDFPYGMTLNLETVKKYWVRKIVINGFEYSTDYIRYHILENLFHLIFKTRIEGVKDENGKVRLINVIDGKNEFVDKDHFTTFCRGW